MNHAAARETINRLLDQAYQGTGYTRTGERIKAEQARAQSDRSPWSNETLEEIRKGIENEKVGHEPTTEDQLRDYLRERLGETDEKGGGDEFDIGVGDFVALASGGPIMTVEAVQSIGPDQDLVSTIWFDLDDRVNRGSFKSDLLVFA